MGDEAEDVITSLTLSEQEESEYEALKGRLDAHFVVRRYVIFERAKFNQRQQEVGESSESFITALHCLAEHCGYGALHSEMIRDRLVVGIRDKRPLEQLQMAPLLTLEKAVTRIRQSELVKKQQGLLKNNFKSDSHSCNVDIIKAHTKPFKPAKQTQQNKAQDKWKIKKGHRDTTMWQMWQNNLSQHTPVPS